MRAIHILCIFGCVLVGSLSANPQSRTSGNQANVPASSQPNTRDDRLREQLAQMEAEQAKLHTEIAVLEQRNIELKTELQTTKEILGVAAGVVSLLFLVGTGVSLIGFFRTEARSREAHAYALTSAVESDKRSAQAFQLALTGETKAQARAAEVHEKFLSGSKETLDLVNATLGLAKEASERAARTIERRAAATIEDLDEESQSLLASVPPHDDRALVANPATRSALRSLAHKISGFEINRFILPDNLQLTPSCKFVRAMDFHLNQQFDDALRNWRSVALSPLASDALKSLAWYWMGYEQNNLNRFSDAEQSFQLAAERATSSAGRKFELQRIVLESRFFNKTKYRAESMIDPVEQLLSIVKREMPSEELQIPYVRIAVTLANVYYQCGRDIKASGNNTDQAFRQFAKAGDLYKSVADLDKWALFGLAEMLYLSGQESNMRDAMDIFRRVRQDAIEESVRREEPRTKVLARTTELICCVHVPEFGHEVPAIRSLVLQELGRVDERLTVYSQLQRRNVTKSEFQHDLEVLTSTSPEKALVVNIA